VISYGDQYLVCLEWGYDESFFYSAMVSGGTLPHAGKGGSTKEVALSNKEVFSLLHICLSIRVHP